MKCGLLGRKLGHSYSPQIHGLMGEYSYELFEKEPEEVGEFLLHGDFDAINVTIPYKKDVIPYLDEIDDIARRLGSVNTIVRHPDGHLEGHNTDYYGFLSLIEHSGIQVNGRKTLVLGTGGTSVTAQAVLEDLGAQVVVISRSGADNYENLNRHYDAQVIVNTTPVGMYPNTGAAPLDIRLFPELLGVLDVIYNPSRTQLLLDAEEERIRCENGLWMLVAQAKLASEFFTGRKRSAGIISSIHRKLELQMMNIVLIGMPGCGKSTVGKLLAEQTGKQFVDADKEIVKLAGKTIPEIFADEGEEAFRSWETRVLGELGKKSGLVIATGGGCVTRERNYPLLYQNGNIFWLRRDLEKLPTEGRPLSQSGNLSQMFSARVPLYLRFSDFTVDNNRSAEACVQDILSMLRGV